MINTNWTKQSQLRHPLRLAIHLIICNSCELEQRIMEEHLRHRTTDTWHLYPTAGTEVSQFTLLQALTSLGQGAEDPYLLCNRMTFTTGPSVKKLAAIS